MKRKPILAALFLGLLICQIGIAQTTELTYQGQLQSAGTAASGSFDFEFALFDAVGGGSQLGSALSRSGVAVTAGIFSVNLDFGSVVPGASRFLEIRVRPAGGGAFTTLSPRQPVNSSPYSVKSLNADTAANANTAATAGTFTGNLAGDVTGTQVSTTVERLRGRSVATTPPTNGQVLKFNSANSQWEPATDETSSGGGTITGVTAGTGLTGGGTTGGVTVAIANGGVGNTQLADGSVTDPKIVSVSGPKVTGAVSNSNQLGGVAANQYVLTNDPRMTDARNPLPGSTGYIQNSAVSQGPANFAFEGNGLVIGTLSAVNLTGSLINSAVQYHLGGNRILSNAGVSNIFVGVNAGSTNSSIGSHNSFFGTSSGDSIGSGFSNSFFGAQSGQVNSSGNSNSFFGFQSGLSNVTGSSNAFFGRESGRSNSNGSNNSFFGASAGLNNLTGSGNSFFGDDAGRSNTSSSDNSFFGRAAGQGSTGGSDNSFFGAESGLVNAGGAFNAFFGSSSGRANTIGTTNAFIGANAGFSNTSGSTNSFAGFESGRQNTTGNGNAFLGHSAGFQNTTASNNTFAGQNTGSATTTGGNNSFFGKGAGTSNTTGTNNTLIGYNAEVSSGDLTFATAIGAESTVSSNNTVVLGRSADTVRVPGSFLSAGQINTNSNLVVAGTTSLDGVLRVTGGTDAEPGGGGFVAVGASLLGPNVVIDENEIMARNATSTAPLFLNADGGNVGIGTNVANDTLDVDGDIRVGTGSTNGCIKNNQGGIVAGTCSSDERFKRDVTPFPSVLNSFTKLRPVHYFFRSNEFPEKHFGPDQTYGLIAQDVEKVLPELVSTDADGFKQIDYAKLPMLTIQAVKEQQAQIESLQKTNRELRTAVCELKPTLALCRK